MVKVDGRLTAAYAQPANHVMQVGRCTTCAVKHILYNVGSSSDCELMTEHCQVGMDYGDAGLVVRDALVS